ncbi:transcriptional regulator, CdaR family [Ruminococcaceae bacterium KH2T8]|nr:transcriptional regulator, CdaR family [Ruminococcaceae bacterium KH2T8]
MEEIKKCMRQTKMILKQDVGVMDTNGLVIASTDPENEGKTDSSARAVMMSDDIFSGTADRTYMKVAIGEQFRYIIYIQSDEPAARTYLELLAEWIKTAVKERGTDAEKELFTKNVLLENELQGEIPIKAREYKINCSEARLVMVVRSSREDGAEVLEILQNFYSDSDTACVLAMDETTAIVVLNAEEAVGSEDERNIFIQNSAQSILDCLNNEGLTVYIGVGSFVSLFQHISKSYRDAMLALRVGKIFEKNCFISRYDKLGLGRLIYQLPATLCQMFIDEVFPNEAYKTLDDDTVATIESFFANNLNGSETSRELYVHRNTLVYRLDKVKKNTGLDLRSFDDAVLFKMASMVRTYLEYLETSKDNMIR